MGMLSPFTFRKFYNSSRGGGGEPMAVITISREFGCSGRVVAQRVAEILGYHLVDKKTIGRLLAGYGLIEFDTEYDSSLGIWAAFDSKFKEMVSMLNRVTRAVARHGNAVILGRGSFVVLAGFGDVLNVRIQAPLPVRIERVMEEESLADKEKAEAVVREEDKVRISFVASMYGARWDNCGAFDLVIDTAKISAERAAHWIADAAGNLEPDFASGAPMTEAIEADPTLDKAVADELECGMAHRP
jgi:cytidylate kinase